MLASGANDGNDTIAAIERVGSRIEDTFARVGGSLGRGHEIFQDLNAGFAALSNELSGTNIEGASVAFRDIARQLTSLAERLPAESRLLGLIGQKAAEASHLLKGLLKHIQMISTISRSARIEAASLDAHRESFQDFTQEASQLAKSVQERVEHCARDQLQLIDAIHLAMRQQHDFDKSYGDQLRSVSADLTLSHDQVRKQQADGLRLTEVAAAGMKRMTESVGVSIVALQAGDSMRQRLEHICHGLDLARQHETALAPADAADSGAVAGLLTKLEASQLEDAARGFSTDLDKIGRALSSLSQEASGVVRQGRALYGDQEQDASFLSGTRTALARASTLIGTCEGARRSVDEALAVVEDILGKFRLAVSELSQTVTDIILIGMNASLKAAHLGAKGSSFVVIANELKATADQISAGATLLQPVLDAVEATASDLKAIRVSAESSQIAGLEAAVLKAIEDVETGNRQVGRVMTRVVEEGAEFETLVCSARDLLAPLTASLGELPGHVEQLRASSRHVDRVSGAAASRLEALLGDLYARYTMVSERDVHARIVRGAGLTPPAEVPAPTAASADVDDLFF